VSAGDSGQPVTVTMATAAVTFVPDAEDAGPTVGLPVTPAPGPGGDEPR
jgi:hypothetical protein